MGKGYFNDYNILIWCVLTFVLNFSQTWHVILVSLGVLYFFLEFLCFHMMWNCSEAIFYCVHCSIFLQRTKVSWWKTWVSALSFFDRKDYPALFYHHSWTIPLASETQYVSSKKEGGQDNRNVLLELKSWMCMVYYELL